MSYEPTKIRLPKLLLEAEAAALLRRSCSHVKRLRLERKLGYFRRRPVTIDEKDLKIYVARAKQRRVLRKEKLKTRPKTWAKGQSETFEYISAGANVVRLQPSLLFYHGTGDRETALAPPHVERRHRNRLHGLREGLEPSLSDKRCLLRKGAAMEALVERGTERCLPDRGLQISKDRFSRIDHPSAY
jgi:hypothetical protein